MIIQKLYIKNCTRLPFMEEDLEINFDRPILTVIGSIGSGKSTILEYTLPHPMSHGDFREGGYRELTLTHNDSVYVLSNHKLGKNKHSILKDGIEVNKGYTVSAYRIYIEKEFGIPAIMYDLLIGNKTFSKGTTNDRKGWFNEMSTIDYTFSLELFKNLSKRMRDLKGAKSIQLENLNELRKEISGDFKYLLSRERSIDDKMRSIYVKIVEAVDVGYDKDLHTKIKKQLDTLSITKEDVEKEEMFREASKDYNVARQSLNMEMKRLMEQTNITKSNEEKKMLSVKMGELKSYIESPFSETNVLRELSFFQENRNLIEETLIQIGELDEFKPYLEKEHFKEELNLLNHNIIGLKNKLSLSRSRYDLLIDLSNTKPVSCPNCSTTFIIGFDDKDKEELDSLKGLLTSLDIELNNKLTKEKELSIIYDKTSLLRTLLYKLNNLSLGSFKIDNLATFNKALVVYERIKDLPDIISKLDTLSISSTNEITIEDIERKYNELNEEYKVITSKLSKVDDTIKNIIKYKELTQQDKEYSRLEKEWKINLDRQKNNEVYQKEVSELRLSLNNVREEISKITIRRERERLLTKELKDLTTKINTLEQMVNALSPKNGLIAESINSFIGTIVTKMNEVISNILDYELVILPPEVEDVNIDYKFKVMVHNNKTPIKDVSSLSTGQRELVDLAFVLVTHEVLGLEMMLYLDEFGNRLDAYHKTVAVKYIQEEVIKDIKQIFIITHYKEGVNASANSSILDLNKLRKV